jgi:DNA-binding NarL/FixJ family response regulator
VAVIAEQEVFRKGLVSALDDDASLEVVVATSDAAVERDDVDVVVVLPDTLTALRLKCPVIVLGEEAEFDNLNTRNGEVHAILSKDDLTSEQLVVAVHAVAAGLHVDAEVPQVSRDGVLNGRQLDVLLLLAGGADTRTIARKLSCSERTVKSLVHDIEVKLGVSNRAQAVAEGIRAGLI